MVRACTPLLLDVENDTPSYWWAVPVLVLMDWIIRYAYLSYLAHPRRGTVSALSADVVRISFPRAAFSYEAGQYVHIMIPKLSIFEWHPFSISSSPHNETVTIHIRVLGNWTKEVQNLARSLPPESPLDIYLEGPCGALSVDFLECQQALEGHHHTSVFFFFQGHWSDWMQSVCTSHVRARKCDEKGSFCVVCATERDHCAMGDAVPNVSAGSDEAFQSFSCPDAGRHSLSESFASALRKTKSEGR